MESGIRTISPLERVLHLKRVASLRDLTPEQLAILAQEARERIFDKGDIVFKSGDTVASFHLIVDGRVHVGCAEHGECTLQSGETLGLLSMLAQWHAGIDARADGPTRTLELEAHVLDEILEDHFDILHDEFRSLACRILEIRQATPEGTYFAPAEGLPMPEGELDLVARLQMLRRNRVFEQANMDVLLRIANALEELRLPAGTLLWRAGEPSGYLLALLAGRVHCQLPDGRSFTCGPGYPLGNLESQCGAPRWYDAVTETPLVAMKGRTQVYIDTLEDHFATARRALAEMAASLIELQAPRLAESQGKRSVPSSDSATSSPSTSATTRQ